MQEKADQSRRSVEILMEYKKVQDSLETQEERTHYSVVQHDARVRYFNVISQTQGALFLLSMCSNMLKLSVEF